MGRASSKGTYGLPSRNRYYGSHCNSRAIHSTSTAEKRVIVQWMPNC